MIDGQTSLEEIHGFGPQVLQKWAKLQCHVAIDLLLHLPSRWEDKTCLTPLRDARVGERALYQGKIVSVTPKRHPRQPVRVCIQDQNLLCEVVFFKLFPNSYQTLVVGRWLRCYGAMTLNHGRYQLSHPEFTAFDTLPGPPLETHLTPVYPVTTGLSQYKVRKAIADVFTVLESSLRQEAAQEKLPVTLMDFEQALRHLHFPLPDQIIDLESENHHPAVKRLVFEEHAAYQFALRHAKEIMQDNESIPLKLSSVQLQRFMDALPFSLTKAQNQVWGEIQSDLSKNQPMMRLVQGDVGSGKTVLAALAAYAAIINGFQAVIMAPTELLAKQLSVEFGRFFAPFDIEPVLLTGSVKGRARTALLKGLKEGSLPLLVGTHALFQEKVELNQGAVMVIDEQHRFGVEQRLALYEKSPNMHQLVMSATPIPRSLAMTMWADLDVSTLDERPPGRQPITTIVLPTQRKEAVIERIDAQVELKHQAYWICTLVNESEKIQAQDAIQAELLLKSALPHRTIACVHGQLPSAEKLALLQSFKEGAIDILVATTVIEVGIDVPNATLIVIENPERLGLAQCHQLRGRVGRGQKPSHCVLLYGSPLSETAKKRLEILRQSDNGFEISEADLKLRGPGEVLGRRQTGAREFTIADIVRDKALLPDILKLTEYMLEHCPETVETWTARWHAGQSVLTKV